MRSPFAFLTWFLIAPVLSVGCGSGEHGQGHEHEHDSAPAPASSPAESAPPANPVQAEMRALHTATNEWITAIANDELERIPPSIHTVHSARQKTEAALEAGTYLPPKNPDRLDEFKSEDEAFHELLVALLRAAKADDLPAATAQVGVVLNGCTSCHTKFRF